MNKEKAKNILVGIALGLLVFAIFFGFGFGYLEWTAYFQRYPDASWWTFFFRGNGS